MFVCCYKFLWPFVSPSGKIMSRKKFLIAKLLLALLLLNVVPLTARQTGIENGLQTDAATAGFKPTRFSSPSRPIVNAPFIKAQEVVSQVAPDELVLGVELNGQARAYPLNMLTGPTYEIINDTLGGHAIAATWCPLCYNGVVYSRQVKGRDLTFGIAGTLWNNSQIMYDAETNSYWSQLMGQAMQGELKGTKLEVLSSDLTTWAAWRRAHPETTVVSLPRTDRKFTSELYDDPSNFVYGWSVGLQRYHCPLYILLSQPILNLQLGQTALLATYDTESTEAHLFSRAVEGRALTFAAAVDGQMRDEQTGTLWDLRTGEGVKGRLKGKRLERRLGMLSYRRAWLAFYPRSEQVTTNYQAGSVQK
jgi:hypothetical protein